MHRLTPAVLISLSILTITVLCVMFAPYIAQHDPTKTNVLSRLQPPMFFGSEANLGISLWHRSHWTRHTKPRPLWRSHLTNGRHSFIIFGFAGRLTGGATQWVRWALGGSFRYVHCRRTALNAIPAFSNCDCCRVGKSLPVLIVLAALATWPYYAR
jgi:hypothetical protein